MKSKKPKKTTLLKVSFGETTINIRVNTLSFIGLLAYGRDLFNGGAQYDEYNEDGTYSERHLRLADFALTRCITKSQRKRIIKAFGEGGRFTEDEMGFWSLMYNNGIDPEYRWFMDINYADAEGPHFSVNEINTLINEHVKNYGY